MSDTDEIGRRITKMFDDLDAITQRISAEQMAERPSDQPSGEEARLSAEYRAFAGSGQVGW